MRLGNSAASLIRGALWSTALAALVSVGCGLKAVPIYRGADQVSEAGLPAVDRDDLLRELDLYRGTPYRAGGNNLSGTDCSGLVRAVYGALGVPLHRTVVDQYAEGVALGRGSVRAGDLVFFGGDHTPTHVGIALSNTRMMHSSSSRGVVVEDIDEFSETMRLIGIRRVANVR